jgi:uncharacterized membrane protein YgcG
MADLRFADTLNTAIDRLNAGISIDDCLRDFPDDAAQLRPLLESGLLVRSILPSEMELASARSRSAERLERALAQTARRAPTSIRPFVWRMAQMAALLVLLFGIAGVAAESSLPGDTLYPLKRLTEGARTLVSGASFDERRSAEIQALLVQGRTEQVQFSGIVEATGDYWRVGGIRVLPPATVPDHIQIGDRAEVQGETTREQVVRATSIRLLDDNTLPLTPSATITATPASTHTPTATLTPTSAPTTTAALTASPSPGVIPTRTIAPTLTPTQPVIPTSAPVISPPVATDDDDDGDDNSGSGSGNSGRGGGDDDGGGDDNGGSDNSGGGGDDSDDDSD